MKTEFVLLAGDLDWGGSRMNLERTIRLLSQVAILKELGLDVVSIGWIKVKLFDDMSNPSISSQGGLELFGVGGAVRNSTGHWAVSCYQIELAYYTLSLQV